MQNNSGVLKLDRLSGKVTFSHIALVMVFMKLLIIGYLLFLLAKGYSGLHFDRSFLLFIGIGFIAEIVDGALGMAYGISCTSLLMNFGIPAKLATASVHTSEIFTTGVSGLSHIKFNNIDKKLFFQIVITGCLGAVLGAYLISDFFDGNMIKPFVSSYLVILGIYILFKAFRKKTVEDKEVKYASVLAFFGGLLDTIGGGGWGPIVTTNLLSQGKNPRQAIGTVNTAEFFVTYFATAVFIFVLGVQHLQIVLGLIIGGVIAAPFGAYIASKINQRFLLIAVGVLIIIVSLSTLVPLLLS